MDMSIATTTPFVGRNNERALLRALLDDASTGRGNLVLIDGEAGIGKSTLVEHLIDEALAAEFNVLTGHCFDGMATPPFAPWIRMFSTSALDAAGSERPDLTTLQGQTTVSLGASTQVMEALATLAREQPTLLVFEDLHWADQASLELLRYVSRDAATHRLLIVATYRDSSLEAGSPLARVLPALVHDARPTRITLDGLDQEAIRALIRLRYDLHVEDEAALGAYLLRFTEGNPLFLMEVVHGLERHGVLCLNQANESWSLNRDALRNMRAPVPSLVRQIIEGRLETLTDEARKLLQQAAVIGQEVPFELWSEITGASDDALIETLEQAHAAQLMVETPDGARLKFRHALFREALYQTLVLPRRRQLHGKISATLLSQPDPDPDAVAYHLEQAGDERAADWWIRAADRASLARAALVAADRLNRAVALLEADPSRARDLGWCLVRLGHMIGDLPGAKTRDLHTEALQIGRQTGDRLLEIIALWSRGALRCFEARDGTDEMERAFQLWSDLPTNALDEAPGGMSRAEFPAAGILAFWCAVFGDCDRAQSYALMELEESTANRHQPGFAIGMAHAALGHAQAATGRPDEARQAFQAAHQAIFSISHYWSAAVVAGVEFAVLYLPYYSDDVAYRKQLVERMESLWVTSAGYSSIFPPRFGSLLWLYNKGDWAEAREVATPYARGDLVHCYTALQVLGLIACHQGDHELAWDCVRMALPDGPEMMPLSTPNRQTLPLLRLAAEMAIAAGERDLALEWIEAFEHWLDASLGQEERSHGRSEAQLLWARYHLAGGAQAVAARHAQAALELASQPRQPLAMLAAQRFLGELATIEDQFDAARAHLQAALTLAERCGAPYERALSLLAMAELQLAAGQQPAALLNEARAILARLGAAPALARTKALIARLTLTAAQDHPAGLTPREIEVLRLLAAGKSNREIAAELFMSVRTAERHISNLYNKIDAHSRAEAIAFAHQHNLV